MRICSSTRPYVDCISAMHQRDAYIWSRGDDRSELVYADSCKRMRLHSDSHNICQLNKSDKKVTLVKGCPAWVPSCRPVVAAFSLGPRGD
jgi:hypothetical protein